MMYSKCIKCDTVIAKTAPSCWFCQIEQVEPEPIPEPDVLPMLAETYEEYATNALRQGDRFAHGIWTQAAEIARGFICTQKTR